MGLAEPPDFFGCDTFVRGFFDDGMSDLQSGRGTSLIVEAAIRIESKALRKNTTGFGKRP